MSIRFMRIMVFYDLPFTTKPDVKKYNEFRKELMKDGYFMIQYSIYCKLLVNDDASKWALKRLEKIKPKHGNIRALVVTEKQYLNMKMLTGKISNQELHINIKRLVEI